MSFADYVRADFTGGCRNGMATTIVVTPDGGAAIAPRRLRTLTEARLDAFARSNQDAARRAASLQPGE